MTPCPRDHTPLADVGAGINRCPTCHRAGWNRDAPGAGAVLAVLEATGGRR